MRGKSVAMAVGLMWCVLAGPAIADNTTGGSQGSTDFSAASARIVNGSSEVLAGSGNLVVSSVEIAGDSVVVVLRSASDAAQVTLNLSSEVVGGASLAVGTLIQTVADSTGYLLTAGSAAIAYVPNEVGRSLLYHARHKERD